MEYKPINKDVAYGNIAKNEVFDMSPACRPSACFCNCSCWNLANEIGIEKKGIDTEIIQALGI